MRQRQTRLARGDRARWVLLTGLALLALGSAGVAAPARADGDPASDYLLIQNIFLPSPTPSASVSSSLEQAADGVYQHGGRVKIAVIYEASDLGSLPSLFGNPSDYAHFLGLELSLWYAGPLLVVMPTGFGIYNGGRSVAQAESLLQSVPFSGETTDDLTRSATTAVNALQAAGLLNTPDSKPPLVTAYPADAKRGKPAVLRFDVFDDSGRSNATIRVYENDELLSTLATPMQFQIGTRHVKVRWLVPDRLRSRRLHFCIVATDPAGNHSAPACADFLRVS